MNFILKKIKNEVILYYTDQKYYFYVILYKINIEMENQQPINYKIIKLGNN